MKLFAYLPGSAKTESAYKFDCGRTKNNVIGITDLDRFNGQGLLSGHHVQLQPLLLFVTLPFGHVMVAPTEEVEQKAQPPKKAGP